MPALGLGTWQSPKGQVKAAVKQALAIGYKHIDCAHIYANEDEIGEAFTEAFTEGTVNREEIFVTSKLWCYDHATEDVLPACKTTLKNLQLDYLDLYLCNFKSHPRCVRDSLLPLGSPQRPQTSIGADDKELLQEPAVAEVALRRGCTGAQVLIRWALQRNTSVLPKSVTPSRIQENFDSLKVELTADDMQLLDSITTRHRYLDLRSYKIDMETMWDGELHGELPTI